MNCVLIVIDSLCYRRCKKSKLELLPNIRALAAEGIICEAMYSQAPFTESAAMSLYCGQNTLDNHGYMERFNNAEATLTEVFEKEGFDVYYGDYVPALFPTSLKRGISSIVYDRGYDINYLWFYRISYYYDLFHKEGLNQRDFNQLIRLFDDNFIGWIEFLEDLIEKSSSVDLLYELNESFDVRKVKKQVIIEKQKYEHNKVLYIKNVLEEGSKHSIFNIDFFEQKDHHISYKTEKIYNTEAKKLCKNVAFKNAVSNLFFNYDIYIMLYFAIKNYLRNRNTEELKLAIQQIKNAVILSGIRVRLSDNSHKMKGQPSFQKHIDHFLSWIDNRKSNTPYFGFLHVDDIHFIETFYSYDINDEKILKDELRYATKNLKKRKWNSPGTVSTDLAILHADRKVRYLVDELKKRRQFEDTAFFVTADHGFTYSGYPIRNKPLHTFYLENFQIPFFAFGKNVKKSHVEALQSGLDIPSTICNTMGFDIPKSFVGEVISKKMRNDEYDNERILTIEYCGGGCPDLDRRRMMIAAFDKKWMVAAKIKKDEVVSNKNIVEIYNLQKDPEQRKNLVNKVSLEKLEKYCNVIQARVNSIRDTDIEI